MASNIVNDAAQIKEEDRQNALALAQCYFRAKETRAKAEALGVTFGETRPEGVEEDQDADNLAQLAQSFLGMMDEPEQGRLAVLLRGARIGG